MAKNMIGHERAVGERLAAKIHVSVSRRIGGKGAEMRLTVADPGSVVLDAEETEELVRLLGAAAAEVKRLTR